MSVSASLTDLGSVALTRTAPPSKARPAPQGAENDDAFGQMVREVAHEQSAARSRDDDRRATRAPRETTPADDRQRPEKPDLPAAALDHRSANARRGDGPRDASEPREAREPRPADRPDEAAVETKPDQPGEPPAADRCGTADAQPKDGDASGAAASEGTKTEAQAPPAPPQSGATNPAPNPVALSAIPSPVMPTQAATTAEAVGVIAATGASPAAVTAGPAAPQAPAADQAAIAAATQNLTETAPALVFGTDEAPATAEQAPETGRVATAGATTAEAPPVQPGGEKAIADSTAKQPATPSDEQKLDVKAQAGEAAKAHQTAGKEATQAAAPRGESDASPPAAATGQSTIQPPASAALEALRAAVADAQPQTNGPAGPGLVQAAGTASGIDLRTAGPLQAPQRHEMPVPLQAVAIEIGMRAMRGAKEFAIRLDPEDLGRIDVKLEVSDAGQVQAKVIVEKVETLQLLQRDARTLERAFDQAGLKTTADGLQFTLRDPGGQGRNGDDQPSRENRGGGAVDEPVIDEIRLQPAQYRLASTGGLDIRI